MAKKDDLKATLTAAGIPFEEDATVAELEALVPQEDTTPTTPKKEEKYVPEFYFAVNVVKLNRAKAWVAEQAKLNGTAIPQGKALEDAVQARYEDIGGLLRGTAPVSRTARGAKPQGRSVNVAPNDGSKD